MRRQAKESRELTASLVALLEGHGAVPRAHDDGALLSDNDDAAATKRLFPGDHAEASVGTPAIKKRKTPVNAFRSTTPRVSSRLAESSTPSSPEPTPSPPEDRTEVLAEKPATKKKGNIMNAFRSSPKLPSRLAQSSTISPKSTPAPPEDQNEVSEETPVNKKRKTVKNASTSSPKIPSRLAQSTKTSPESTPAPTKKALKLLAAQEKEKDQTVAPTTTPSTTTAMPRASSGLAQSSPTSPELTPQPTSAVPNPSAAQEQNQDQDQPPPPTKSPLATATPSSTKSTTPKPNSRASLDRNPSLSASKSPKPRASTPTGPIPPASTIPHLGPIYRDKRAILSRPKHKPYIHALCGDRFGHPAEVQRHHNGQGGRPGCWAKKGKPSDEAGGAWDEHVSCKVKLTDLGFVRVRDGFVVTSWGGVRGVEGLREGEEEVGEDHEGVGEGGGEGEAGEDGAVNAAGVDAATGVDAAAAVDATSDVDAPVAAVAGVDGVEGGKKRKKTMLKLKVRAPIKTEATGGESGKGDADGGLKEFVDAQSSPEPAEKRQKTLDTPDADTTTPMEIDAAQSSLGPPAEERQKSLDTGDDAAAARSVVFGLRARK